MRSLQAVCGSAILSVAFILHGETLEKADAVIRNAKVITVDKKFSIAQAVAVRGDKIIFTGKNSAVKKFIGDQTQVIDAKGKTLLPGLYDSHVHSYKASVSTLDGGSPVIHSIAEAQEWVRGQAAKKPPGTWIVLERVYATRMKEMRLPTKAELDAAAPHHPVLWNSGPVSIVNSEALKVSGISRDTPNPTPGEIVKDAKTGEPTGVLRNAAQLLKNPIATRKPTAQEQREAVKQLYRLYNQQGITSIGERRTDYEAIDLFRDLEKTGELTVRINCTRMMEPVPQKLDDAIKKLDDLTFGTNHHGSTLNYGPTGVGDDWVRIGPLKVLLDGGMLIGTAYMREPWGKTDVFQITDPDYHGLLNVKPELLNALYLEAAKRGWQLTAHCVGDGAMDVLLDCYDNIAKQNDIRSRRFILTHANFVTERNLQRAEMLGAVADLQPAWLYKDGMVLRNVLGDERMKDFFPLKRWFDHGIIVGGGSDHMVQTDSVESTNPWNPWLGMWVALTRQTERGGQDKPEQRITREQAIRFYTMNNCYLNFEETRKGSLESGKYADLILVDRDVLECPIDELRDTKVLLTMVGGRKVWQRDF
jgi:predicted amidohydrolase YtcJ